MYDIVDSILTMSMDIYRQTNSQNEDTGEIKKEWTYYKTIPCHAKGNISNTSSTARSGNQQSFGAKYNNEQILQVRTNERLTYRIKITNIKDSAGNVIWSEINFPTESPTVFEIIGITPMTDPFGNVVGYNNTIMRSENQKIGY